MFPSLTKKANEVLKTEFGQTDSTISWTVPREDSFGDASTNIALQLASKLKKKPQEIAKAFCDALKTFPDVAKAEVAGAGYVNVWLTPEALLKELVASRSAHKPLPMRKKDAPVIIEYSQPNIAKPLGAHHIIGTVVGQALCNIYRHLGYPVIAWNYLGDWGTQFGKLAVAFEKWGNGKKAADATLDELLDLYVRFNSEAEKDATLDELGREAFRKLEEGDRDLRAFWEQVVTVTRSSLEDIYRRLHVSFDLDLGESFYSDKMGTILEEGKKKGVFKAGKEGSLIVEFPEESGMPPYLVQKGDGATLYSTRDIAQMRYRMDAYHPAAIYILTDIAQKLHFEQLVATCKQLGWTLPTFENVLFGRMRFADRKMSTRKGNILKLEHVLDEAVKNAEEIIKERGDSIQTDDESGLAEMMGTGALVYGILSQNRKMDIVFDWDKMLSFEGNSAPYVQYTHARGQSILRKAEAKNDVQLPVTIATLADAERSIIRLLLQMPAVLEDARECHMPHKLATYLYELCQGFNSFYSSQPILTAEGETRELRIALTACVVSALKVGAEILTMRVPDRM